MGTCPDVVKRLIDRFNQQADQVRSPDYNETQLRIDFVNPLFAALGWDMDNTQGFAEQYREVVHEDRVRVGGASKAPDYSFRIGGVRKFFLETKKPAVSIKNDWRPAYQLRRYGWSAKLPVSLLTDFEELAVYDCRIAPKQMGKSADARREYITYTQYPERWDFLEGAFSKRAIQTGEFDRYCASKKGRGSQEFDEAFLEEIESWRKLLANNLALRNAGLDAAGLNFATQRIIDRIIFLRICESRGAEPAGNLEQLLNGQAVYARLLTLFREADARYNSGLFHFKRETGREETPDELTPSLDVDDAALKQIIKRLYYPESPYEFSVVSADILGSVYERFLGSVIELTPAHRVKIEPKPEVRKAGGVYYTPTYIVDYIVKQTVGKLLEGKTPKEAARLKVLDPACGSGSFLLGAYQHLLDWHLKWYVEDGVQKHSQGKHATIRPADRPSYTSENAGAAPSPAPAAGYWALTTRERKRILLDNIHGVDIDYQAVEVTKLSLLLRCLEGETSESIRAGMTLFRERALPDLGRNILCGNSLIGADIMTTDAWRAMSDDERRRINPFDFERAFPRVFKQGGFDAVIGNPPYIRMEQFALVKSFLAKQYAAHEERADLYTYFLERGLFLLAREGYLGEIVSNKFIRAKYGLPIRRLLADKATILIVSDFAGANVFAGATVRTVVLILRLKGEGVPSRPTYIPVPSPTMMESLRTRQRTLECISRISAIHLASDAFSAKEWRLTATANVALIEKFRSRSLFLSDFLNAEALFGIKTGRNEAFIVDESLALSLDPSREVVKPILFGKDIRRYFVSSAGRHVIYLHPNAEPNHFPQVMQHLLAFRKELSRRAGPQEWYELQQPAVKLLRFQSEAKIVFPIIAKECRFALDFEGYLINDKAFILPSADRALVGLLNSRVANFYFSQVCAALEGPTDRYLEFRSQYVDVFPVPSHFSTAPERKTINHLVQTIVKLHTAHSAATHPQEKERLQREIEATDRQIDQLVYQLYDLTDEEIRLVEEATQ